MEDWLNEAEKVLNLFQRQTGFQSAKACLAMDDDTTGLIFLHFDSVGNYRRALSAYEIKLDATEFLSRAIDEPTAFEVLISMNQHEKNRFHSEKTSDAEEVALGESASAKVQSRTEI